MPEDIKQYDYIAAYRNYYIKHKKDFATWKASALALYKTV